jgi:hypothetical protein
MKVPEGRRRKRRGKDPAWPQQAAERLDQVLASPILVLTALSLSTLVLPVIYAAPVQ